MKRVDSVHALRGRVRAWRAAGERVVLVPTMGNLHRGHTELVEHARGIGDRVLVSIFVNPMQFGQGEDFASYPRTLEADAGKLEAAEADLLFHPGVEEVYPRPAGEQTRVEVPGLSAILCGASRPGHFVGVATVVCKLLNMAQPDAAVFGEKDFQQLMVIRRMVEDLAMPVEIVGVPTVREPDGLALSSRNGYLTVDERRRAPALYRVLAAAAEALREGRSDYGALETAARDELHGAGLRPDYFEIRRQADLGIPGPGESSLVVVAAAYLGRARLIDNLSVSR